ncbi:hypothetical protein C922_02262 [Plasmodium inui San Antonio 1]|uniref:Uncharacterized protein n=1 Tax=Plasmodium inui San Antonio 1 TaxID=1237626 RepID=W7AQ67_9APIC|nr:hypothetical protein C922_02262 [Plasmodium inui San Antonio 1]EUD67556.1 hypothetical protein C922_02262 [Plasmodium inui San Antonio 1]
MNVSKKPYTKEKLVFLWFKNVLILTLCFWTYQYYNNALCDELLERNISVERPIYHRDRRILQGFDDIQNTKSLGLREFRRNKNGHSYLCPKSVFGPNSELEGEKEECERSHLGEKIENSHESDVIGENDDNKSSEIEKTIVNSEGPKLVLGHKDSEKCYLRQSSRNCNNSSSTHFACGGRSLAQYEMYHEAHIPGRSGHLPPHNNKYQPQHVGGGHNKHPYPNNFGSNFVERRNAPGFGEAYDSQFNSLMKMLSDCKETCESQFEGVKKFITDQAQLTQLPVPGIEKIISGCKDWGQMALPGVKKIISDCKEVYDSQITNVKQFLSDCKETYDFQFIQDAGNHPHYSGYYENQQTGNGNNPPPYPPYYGPPHTQRGVGRNEPHYSVNHQYQSVTSASNQSNYDRNYRDKSQGQGGNTQIHSEKYDSHHGTRNTKLSSYHEYNNQDHYSERSIPKCNNYYQSQYGHRNSNYPNSSGPYRAPHAGGHVIPPKSSKNYDEPHVGENADQPSNSDNYKAPYTGENANHPNNSSYYKAPYDSERANTANHRSLLTSDYKQSEANSSTYTQEYGPQEGKVQNYTYGGGNNYHPPEEKAKSNTPYRVGNLAPDTELSGNKMASVANSPNERGPNLSTRKKMLGSKGDLKSGQELQENNLAEDKSETCPMVSPNDPALNPGRNCESGVTEEKTTMAKFRMSIHSRGSAVRQDISNNENILGKECAESSSKTNQHFPSSSLKRNSYNSEVNVATKMEQDKNLPTLSQQRLNLSTMSKENTQAQGKNHFHSQMNKPEDKATKTKEESGVSNSGLRQESSHNKPHLNCKGHGTSNVEEGERNRNLLSQLSVHKTEAGKGNPLDSKVYKSTTTPSGRTGNPELDLSAMTGKNSDNKLHSYSSKDDGETSSHLSTGETSLSGMSLRGIPVKETPDFNTQKSKPEQNTGKSIEEYPLEATGNNRSPSNNHTHLHAKGNNTENLSGAEKHKVLLSPLSKEGIIHKKEEPNNCSSYSPENKPVENKSCSKISTTSLKGIAAQDKVPIGLEPASSSPMAKGGREQQAISTVPLKHPTSTSGSRFHSEMYEPKNKKSESANRQTKDNKGIEQIPRPDGLKLDTNPSRAEIIPDRSSGRLQLENAEESKNKSNLSEGANVKTDKEDSRPGECKGNETEIKAVGKTPLECRISFREHPYGSKPSDGRSEASLRVNSELLKDQSKDSKEPVKSNQGGSRCSSSNKEVNESKDVKLDSDKAGTKNVHNDLDESLKDSDPGENTQEKGKGKKRNCFKQFTKKFRTGRHKSK